MILVGIPQIRMALVTIRDNLKTLKVLLDAMEAEDGGFGVKQIKNKPSITSLASEQSSVSQASNNTAALNSKFREEMTSFFSIAQATYDTLDSKFKAADKEFETACILYAEEPKTTTPEDFFGIFSKFIQGYKAAKLDNEAASQKDIQEKKREEAKKTAAEKIDAKKREKSEMNLASAAGGKEVGLGGLDDLISSIRTGKAFQGKSVSRKGTNNNLKEQDPNVSVKKLRQGHNNRESIMQKSKDADADIGGTKKPTFQNLDQGAIGRLKRTGDRTLAEKLG